MMSTVQRTLPAAGQARRPLPMTWWSHLLWMLAAAILGLAVAAVFAGVLRLQRSIYLVFYVGLIGAFLYSYLRWSHTDLGARIREHWVWGLIGGAAVGFFAVQTVLTQSPSAVPQGAELVFDLVWLGLIYGAIDGVLLSVLPVYATWQALTLLGWTGRWQGRIAAGVLALLASMLVIGAYHLGYPEFRGPQVLLVMIGVGIQSLAYVLSGSPLAPVISHIAMHIAAVLYGINSVSQLPPHY